MGLSEHSHLLTINPDTGVLHSSHGADGTDSPHDEDGEQDWEQCEDLEPGVALALGAGWDWNPGLLQVLREEDHQDDGAHGDSPVFRGIH